MQNFFFSRICSGREMSTNGIEDEVKTFVCHFFYGLETKRNLRDHTYMLPHHGSKLFKILAPRIYGKTFFVHTRTYTHTTLMRYHCWVSPLALVDFGFISTLYQLCSCCRKHFMLTHYEVSLHQSRLQRNGFICSSSFT